MAKIRKRGNFTEGNSCKIAISEVNLSSIQLIHINISMEEIKNQLIKHIDGGEAFMPVDKMWNYISLKNLCTRPKDLPYSFYEIFYHMRFAQKDILDYILDEDYTSHEWPQDYWPSENKLKSQEEWNVLVLKFKEERQQLINYISKEEHDLLKPLNADTNHSLLREVLLVIEHNAYHSGQLLIVLRSLGLYPA